MSINSPNALRMLSHLAQYHQPAPEPEVPRARSTRVPGPASPPPRNQTRNFKAKGRYLKSKEDSDTELSESSGEESDYSSSSSDYEDTDVIYQKVVEEAKCPRVSPAGLKSHSKSRKEAASYLKSKECPEVPKLKKSAAKEPAKPKENVTFEAPHVEVTEAGEQVIHNGIKKTVKRKVAKAEPAAAPSAAAPAAPAAAAKTKRAPSAWNAFASEHMKAGKSMKEVAAMWKEKKGGAA